MNGPLPVKDKKNQLNTKHASGRRSILFIGCRVWTFPTDFDARDVLKIYSNYDDVRVQNLDRSKLTTGQSIRTSALPLGLDLHSLEQKSMYGLNQTQWQKQLDDITNIRQHSKALIDRIPRILVTWARNKSTSARHRKSGYLMRSTLYDEARSSPLFEFSLGKRIHQWTEMSKFAFVFSPIGNGFDCHRFWEAIVLGCIVIVQKNPTANEFSDCFPVIQVENIKSITTDNLLEWHSKFRDSTPLWKVSILNWLGPEPNQPASCGPNATASALKAWSQSGVRLTVEKREDSET